MQLQVQNRGRNRSCNLFPLPGPLVFGFLRRSSACIPAGVPEGEGNLFLGMWLYADTGNACTVTPAR